MKNIIFAGIAVFALSGSLLSAYGTQSQNNYRNQSGQYKKVGYQTQDTQHISDSQLQGLIEEQLLQIRDANRFDGVDIYVEEGHITLGGTVQSSDDERELISTIESIQGVQSVKSEIRVNGRSWQNQSSQNSLHNKNQPTERSHQQGRLSDREVQEKIRDNLRGGWFSDPFKDVKVSVRNGEVELRGLVSTEKDRRELLNRVHSVKGVAAINNQVATRMASNQGPKNASAHKRTYQSLAGQEREQTEISDSKLEKEIARKLGHTWQSKFFTAIKFSVENGKVYLNGTVTNNDQRDDLITLVESIDGVKSVQSHVQVETSHSFRTHRNRY